MKTPKVKEQIEELRKRLAEAVEDASAIMNTVAALK